LTRLHIVPYLGVKRLDKLQVRDVRQWLNKLARVCRCCNQGKDAARAEGKQRCCAIGRCCQSVLSPRSRSDARDTLRAALACAVEDEETISRNVAAGKRLLPAARRRKRHWWSVDDARKFLESARHDGRDARWRSSGCGCTAASRHGRTRCPGSPTRSCAPITRSRRWCSCAWSRSSPAATAPYTTRCRPGGLTTRCCSACWRRNCRRPWTGRRHSRGSRSTT
jgi:hypothetical protein